MTREGQPRMNVGKYFSLRKTEGENRYSVDFQHNTDIIFTSNIVLTDEKEIQDFSNKLIANAEEKEQELEFYLSNWDQKTFLKKLDEISDSTVMKMRMENMDFDNHYVENFEATNSKWLDLSDETIEVKEEKENIEKINNALQFKWKWSLTSLEKMEVENVFKWARDFREVGEKITAPIDSIINETTKIIDQDPIMKVSDELKQMNGKVQWVYKDIIDNDSAITKWLKALPLIWGLVRAIDEKKDSLMFDMKSTTWKIDTIFSGFDTSFNSLNTSIDLQEKFSKWLEDNLNKVILYHEFVSEKLEEFKWKAALAETQDEKDKFNLFIGQVEYFKNNLTTLIGNLQLTQKRIYMRLDSSHKLSLAMSSSRPIFKTLLSTAIIEMSSQKAIDASIDTINVMWQTIDKMSSELTDKAIQSSRRTEELTSKTVLSTSVFIENVAKLKNHFDTIEQYREKVKLEAEREKVMFDEAKEKLKTIKTLKVADHKEFQKELWVLS